MANILVLDSEANIRKVISLILSRAGHDVCGTGDFAAAIAMIRESQPDLLLTNVNLKGITGHEAMHKVREDFPELPVLMVSGLPDDKLIREWIDAPDFDVFPRPFSPASLVEKVRQMLNPQGAPNGAGANL
jgi:DNA-binding response OmpR family regulator